MHHLLNLTCDDVHATTADREGKGVEFRGEPEDLGFGIGVTVVLPGGVELLLFRAAPRVTTRPLTASTGQAALGP